MRRGTLLQPYQISDMKSIEYKPRISTESTAVVESIIGGVKQGSKPKSMSLRGASVLSRVRMWNLLHEICTRTSGEGARWRGLIESKSYSDFKNNGTDVKAGLPWLVARSLAAKEAKHVLKPWIPNRGDEEWCREDILALTAENKKRKHE